MKLKKSISYLHRLFDTIFILCFCMLISACGSRIPAPQNFKAQAQIYHQKLNERAKAIKSISGELSVELWENNKRVSVRQLFAAQAPNRLRMDTLTPFEQPLATIIFNEQLLSVHDRENNRFIIGEASPKNFERLTKLRLKPREMSTLLNGQVPRIKKTGGKVSWDEIKGRAKLVLNNEEYQEIITFDEKDKTPRMVEFYQENKLLIRIFLADYSKEEPKVPQRLKLKIPSSQVVVNTTLVDYTLNPKLPARAFQITTPPGLEAQDFGD